MLSGADVGASGRSTGPDWGQTVSPPPVAELAGAAKTAAWVRGPAPRNQTWLQSGSRFSPGPEGPPVRLPARVARRQGPDGDRLRWQYAAAGVDPPYNRPPPNCQHHRLG